MISDRTLGEALKSRLRELRVFELFVRALGPGLPVYISARWFDSAGVVCTTRGEGEDLAAALLQLLAEIRRVANVSATQSPRSASKPPMPPLAIGPALRAPRSRAIPQDERRGDPLKDHRGGPDHRRRVALEISARLGWVTAGRLRESIGGGREWMPQDSDEHQACAATLADLATEGELRHTSNGVYAPTRTR